VNSVASSHAGQTSLCEKKTLGENHPLALRSLRPLRVEKSYGLACQIRCYKNKRQQ